MTITPTPDMVTRVFMLFKGVKDTKGWEAAVSRAQDDVALWTDIVGAKILTVEEASKLFTVLEWGGMEVTRPYREVRRALAEKPVSLVFT